MSTSRNSSTSPRRLPRKTLCLAFTLAAGFLLAFLWQEYHWRQAVESVQRRERAAALSHLDQVELLRPSLPKVCFLRARLARRQGDFEQMKEYLKLARDGGHPVEQLECEQWLAIAQSGHMNQARRYLPELLQNSEEDAPEICEAYVNGYFVAFAFDEALRLLEGWKADFPEDAQPYVFEAAYAEHRGHTAEEIRSYRTALELAPWRHDIREKLLKPLLTTHNYQEALEHVSLLLREDHPTASLLTIEGDCYLSLGKPERARQSYGQAVQMDPRAPDARLGMGKVQLEGGRPEEALEWLSPLAEDFPYRSDIRFSLATAFQRAGLAEEAKPHFEFVERSREMTVYIRKLIDEIPSTPDDFQKRLTIGRLLAEYGPPQEAIWWLESVQPTASEYAEAQALLAELHASRPDNTEPQ